MVKKLRFHESRTSRRRRSWPREQWVLEPLDGVFFAAGLGAVLWLQLFSHTT